MNDRPFSRRAFYAALQLLCRLVAVLLFGIRCYNRHRMPDTGAVLLCANHQSYFDPMLLGVTFNRRLNYLARRSLFRFGPFGWLISVLDAIPLERDGMGIAGLRESLRRLMQGEIVQVFPEGTRTADGNVASLKPGFCVLARRGHATLVPVGIDGAYDAWPRTARLPRLSKIRICVGEPIPPEWVRQADDPQLIAELERRIRACQIRAKHARMDTGCCRGGEGSASADC